MSGQFWTVNSDFTLSEFVKHVRALYERERYVTFTWKVGTSRSLDQNSLYWRWLSVLAESFSKRGGKYTKDDMHDLMRHKFIGYESRKIGNTELKDQLKSTTKLTKSEMSDYMTQIEVWASE